MKKPEFDNQFFTSILFGLLVGLIGVLIYLFFDVFVIQMINKTWYYEHYYIEVFILSSIFGVILHQYTLKKQFKKELEDYDIKVKKSIENDIIQEELRVKKELEEKKIKEINEKNKSIHQKNILEIISQLDKDQNGEVDLVDGESFNKILNKNQQTIIEIDKNYIQKFVKITMYLKTKKINTQKIFKSIGETKDEVELTELVNLLKNQIHTYELLVFHSISMITSLVKSDLITFYEIYECFDQLGVFNSNWENEVSNKLTNIGEGIRDLMYSIYQMESKIVNSIDNLTYVTQDSFKELNISVNNQLSSIDSSIKFNNLLTGIQTYQMYKINQNTKGIN